MKKAHTLVLNMRSTPRNEEDLIQMMETLCLAMLRYAQAHGYRPEAMKELMIKMMLCIFQKMFVGSTLKKSLNDVDKVVMQMSKDFDSIEKSRPIP